MEFLVPQNAVTPYERQELQESQSSLLGHQRKTSLHIPHWYLKDLPKGFSISNLLISTQKEAKRDFPCALQNP